MKSEFKRYINRRSVTAAKWTGHGSIKCVGVHSYYSQLGSIESKNGREIEIYEGDYIVMIDGEPHKMDAYEFSRTYKPAPNKT